MTSSSEYLRCAITKPSVCRNKRHSALGNNPIAGKYLSFWFVCLFFDNSIPASFLWLLFLGKEKKKVCNRERLRTTVHHHFYTALNLKKVIHSECHPANRLANIQIQRWCKDPKYSFCNKIQIWELMLNMANKLLWFPTYCSTYLLEHPRQIICQKHDFAFAAYELFPLPPSPVESKQSGKRTELSWNMVTCTGSAFRKFWGYT